MALRINTNVAALNAHKNMIKTDNSLSESLGRLSSGLRINKAADDASGMAIADSLRSQKLGLGQAIRNGNDGVNIVQTADAALEESINIVNTIKTKAIQAAQDGQTTDSRKAIQADITKLTDELDTIAKTTSFNNQKLLSGNFTNKKFQMGAYAGETIDISIASTEANKIGHVTTSNLTFGGEGKTELNVYSASQNKNYTLNEIELAYDNTAEHGVSAVADSINRLSDVLGISATATVETSTSSAVAAGTTDSDFAINGVNIGAITVQKNDADGALAAEINKKTSEHGVVASVDESGALTLTSSDGRAIEVTQGADTTAVLGDTDKMSTFGKVELRQEGTGEILITDVNPSGGVAVSVEDGGMKIGALAASTKSFTFAEGSSLVDSQLASGTVINGEFTISGADVTGMSTDDNVIGAGSTLISGSVIGSGTTLTGSVLLGDVSTAFTAGTDSVLAKGSVLTGGAQSVIAVGSVFDGDVSQSFSGGTFKVSGGSTIVTGATKIKSTETLTLTGDAYLKNASVMQSGTILAAGTNVHGDLTTAGTTTLATDMTLTGGNSSIESGSTLTTGSSIKTITISGFGTVAGDMTFTAGTIIGANSIVGNGSSFDATVTTSTDEVVSTDKDMLLGVGSVIAAGSTLTTGTVLTNDILADDGTTYAKGTTLEYDIVTGAGAALKEEMAINGGSILKAGTQLAKNTATESAVVDSSVDDAASYRLADIDVTTQEGAQVGIAVADAALKSLDKVRSDLGSVQNQLTSTIANISTTKVNVAAAESSIRDVDFAEESANFTKMQILSQAGSFAMSQANSSSQNVMSLLR